MIRPTEMSTTPHIRTIYPHSTTERDEIRLELRGIISSSHFCNSKRYPAFLSYVVEETLAGRGDTLKERTIGVEVFDRQATYDTNSDGVVRFTAGEVRKRLAAYYHDSHHLGLRISLPLGTYVPSFSVELDPDILPEGDFSNEITRIENLNPEADARIISSEETLRSAAPQISTSTPNIHEAAARVQGTKTPQHLIISAAVALMLLLTVGAFWSLHKKSPVDLLWQPFLRDRGTILVCAGGNTLSASQNAGLITADKATAYPYFSLQTMMSIERLSSFIERNGATSAFNFAASTPLPELHSHPIVLLNAYNNQWTLRLVERLRFHFSPDIGPYTNQSIVDRNSAGTIWKRDYSLPESDTDDYALIARFWDTVTDNWVLVLAGIGKNGTEAATQFVTSPHYAQILQDRIGKFGTKNIEVVLRVNVIDGKTGSPSIVTTYVW